MSKVPAREATRPRYKRVVAKFGTNLLTGGGERLDTAIMTGLVEQLAQARAEGVQVVVVTSGAIAAGSEVLGSVKTRRDIPYKQVQAAVGQSRLMGRYAALFGKHGINVAQALITKSDVEGREGYLNVRNTLDALLELGIVPIVNENDVVDIREIGESVFGDNDRLSAAVANLIDADLLVILSDIDGLYTDDPRSNPEAKLLERVERIDEQIMNSAGGTGSARGRGGMLSKVEAAKVATASGIPVVVANGYQTRVLERLLHGEAVGTLFTPSRSRMDSRRRWLLSGLSQGSISVDSGAAKALREQHRSLLPAGVRTVQGSFVRGDLVEIRDGNGAALGSGLSNYSAADVQKLAGAKSSDIAKLLGYTYGDEVVHRDNLVLLESL